MNFNKKTIMVVVAHPDDEVLGVGGTINKLINDYDCFVHVVILGEGITSRYSNTMDETAQQELKRHKQNILNAKEQLGYNSISIYDLPDNRFDSIDLLDIVKIIELEKQKIQPEIIFTHHGGDLNIDHQRTFEAVITATRPLEYEIVSTIITFETPSGTEWRASSDPKHFIPNLFISISKENLESKINAMEQYDYEKRNYPHPRAPKSLEIIANRWGIVVGQESAEAFCLIRKIM